VHQWGQDCLPEAIALSEHVQGKETHKHGEQNTQNAGCPKQQSVHRSFHGYSFPRVAYSNLKRQTPRAKKTIAKAKRIAAGNSTESRPSPRTTMFSKPSMAQAVGVK
jgi:hypothetical protein